MSRKPLCILVAGDPVPATQARVGGFGSLIRAALRGCWEDEFVEVDARTPQPLPSMSAMSGVIVTGSASSVTERAPWMLRTERLLAELVASEQAVLGICFGHQLLGQGLGGFVERNPRGREMGTVELVVTADDPLLNRRLAPWLVQTTHVDSVTVLPKLSQVLATTELEPHAALRFGARAWGVQFHPEFDAQTMTEYLTTRREILIQEGRDADALLKTVRTAEAGKQVLRRFVEHAVLGR